MKISRRVYLKRKKTHTTSFKRNSKPENLASEKCCFSSPFVAGDFSRETFSAAKSEGKQLFPQATESQKAQRKILDRH